MQRNFLSVERTIILTSEQRTVDPGFGKGGDNKIMYKIVVAGKIYIMCKGGMGGGGGGAIAPVVPPGSDTAPLIMLLLPLRRGQPLKTSHSNRKG